MLDVQRNGKTALVRMQMVHIPAREWSTAVSVAETGESCTLEVGRKEKRKAADGQIRWTDTPPSVLQL